MMCNKDQLASLVNGIPGVLFLGISCCTLNTFTRHTFQFVIFPVFDVCEQQHLVLCQTYGQMFGHVHHRYECGTDFMFLMIYLDHFLSRVDN